jgi:hypothetical protein
LLHWKSETNLAKSLRNWIPKYCQFQENITLRRLRLRLTYRAADGDAVLSVLPLYTDLSDALIRFRKLLNPKLYGCSVQQQ